MAEQSDRIFITNNFGLTTQEGGGVVVQGVQGLGLTMIDHCNIVGPGDRPLVEVDEETGQVRVEEALILDHRLLKQWLLPEKLALLNIDASKLEG